MDQKYIEITNIDPKRWAVLHIPLGILLSIWVMVLIFRDSGLDLDSVIFLLLAPPCIIFTIMGFAWLYAQALNLIFKWMGKGPILKTQSLERGRHGEIKRQAWD